MTLKERYKEEIIPFLKKELGYKNSLQVPRLEKLVINVGIGDGAQNAKLFDAAIEELTLITGQKPLITRSKKSVAGFKVRQGMPIGAKVTLRGDRMYDFLAKITCIVLPRIRDFRGLNPKGFDGRGNYNLGLTDQLVFPEINYDKVQRPRGMNITLVTSATNDREARLLLEQFGFPFKKSSKTENAEAPQAQAS
jgi:large subunit ribosomal protein L5